MIDLLLIASTVLFFLLTWGFIKLCEVLMDGAA